MYYTQWLDVNTSLIWIYTQAQILIALFIGKVFQLKSKFMYIVIYRIRNIWSV